MPFIFLSGAAQKSGLYRFCDCKFECGAVRNRRLLCLMKSGCWRIICRSKLIVASNTHTAQKRRFYFTTGSIILQVRRINAASIRERTSGADPEESVKVVSFMPALMYNKNETVQVIFFKKLKAQLERRR